MNNAVFGKTMENVRERVDVKLVTAWEGRCGAEALIAKPNFHSRSVFAENLIAVELRKLEVKFDKPIYVGMCILDISKTCLYEFHHDYMTPLFRDRCEIMYTDTDSLIYHIECDDVYETMKRDIDRFDTSDYPANIAYGMPLANKKVPGLMKDENNGAIMTEFVGLRAKMYALRIDGKRDTKKAKGVKSSVVARTISFEDYSVSGGCLKLCNVAASLTEGRKKTTPRKQETTEGDPDHDSERDVIRDRLSTARELAAASTSEESERRPLIKTESLGQLIWKSAPNAQRIRNPQDAL
ncbi:hypothetical protein ALC62_02262 [Cyphomyrmex costatus]|uniref:DNA-directed DNA polymerase n=1 Tax=Cyphomyrmex costatus TaxID=456900 RepID=A0A151IN60_9HYME|nr:hypothetical protein ALC62_02262 [Cyphomyrmex costatus]